MLHVHTCSVAGILPILHEAADAGLGAVQVIAPGMVYESSAGESWHMALSR